MARGPWWLGKPLASRDDVHGRSSPSHHSFPELAADVWGKVCACMGESAANHCSETKLGSRGEIWELLFKDEGSLE